jgi:hypothetical protein
MAKRTKKDSDSKRSVICMFRPAPVDHVLALAKRVEAGEEISIADLQVRLSAAEYDAAYKAEKTPCLYNPALVQMASAKNCLFALDGQAKTHVEKPDNWPSALNWVEGRYVGEYRTLHENDLRRNVIDRDKNLIEHGAWCLVLGDSDQPAIMALHGSVGDNTFAHIARAAKSLAFKGQYDKLANLFIRLNTAACKVAMTGDGCGAQEVVVFAYQVGTPGYVERDGKRLSADQIRKAFKLDENGKLVDSDGIKGLKWVPLTEVIIGTPFTAAALVSRVKQTLGAKGTIREAETMTGLARYENRNSRRSEIADNRQDLDTGIVTNIGTMTRNALQVAFPFGGRHSFTGSGIYFNCFGATRKDKRFNVALGVRCGVELSAAAREAVRPAKPDKAPKAPEASDSAEVPTAEVPTAEAAPKAPKAKKAVKVKAKKVVKAKKAATEPTAPVVSEPAAPVSDTSDQPVEVGEPETPLAPFDSARPGDVTPEVAPEAPTDFREYAPTDAGK